MGVERVLEVLKEIGTEIPAPAADVYAIIPDASSLPQVFRTVQQLRTAGRGCADARCRRWLG